MLLAQPFDPFKEQQRKLPFFARCRIISRTRRALLELKNKMHNNSKNRQFQPVMMPDHHYMLPTPPQQIIPPQSWYCYYGCCYDPYLSPMMIPPPSFPIHPHQLLYSICVHFSPRKEHQNIDSTSLNESTLYSSSSSMHSDNEKSLVDVGDSEDRYYRNNYPVLSRSNSDVMLNRRRPNQRPSINRWNSTNNNIYYRQ